MRILFCLFMCTVPALAQLPILLSNTNFDEDLLIEGAAQATASGWQVIGDAGAFNPTQTQYPEDDGNRQTVGYTNDGNLFQVTNEPLIAGKDYTLTLEVGHRNDVATQAPFTIRFIAAGQVLAQTGGYNIPPGQWRDVTLTLTVSDAHPVGSLLEVHLISTGAETHYDNLTLTRKASGNMVSDAILSDKTLYVPGHYPTIQAALNSFALKRIAPDAIVTIQVADGTYTDYETVFVDHPDGNKIQIMGNITDPALCTLAFKPGVSGISVSQSRALGMINGFTLKGVDYTGIGISASSSSSIKTGSEIMIQGFYRGVQASHASSMTCPGIQAFDNMDGIVAVYSSSVSAPEATAAENVRHGFATMATASMYAASSISKNNGSYGYFLWLNSSLIAYESLSQENLYGYVASSLGFCYIPNFQALDNGTDFSSSYGGVIYP